jgi:hypothetical protein
MRTVPHSFTRPFVLLAAVAAASTALAVQAAAPQGEAPYVSGGIGEQEVRQIESQEGAFNVRMVFSEGPKNDYVANVTLRIADNQGHTVLALDDAGPLTNVRLPPGRYSVSTRYGSQERRHVIEVKPGTPVDLFMHYPRQTPQSVPSPGETAGL